MRTRTLIAAALTSSSLAHGYAYELDRAGEPVRWERDVVLSVDAELEPRLGAPGARAAIDAAAGTLGAELGKLTVSTRAGSGGSVGFDFSPGAVNRNDVVALDDWAYDEEAAAVTVLTVDNRLHRIVDADVAFDARGTRWDVTDAAHPRADRFDVQNAMTHELGHLAGLAHSQDPEATMFPKTHPSETSKRRFAVDDHAALAGLYAQGAEADAPEAAGCSATGGANASVALLGLLALLRRVRVAAALLVLLPALQARAEPPARARKVAVVARVMSVTTLPPQPGVTVLQTELWVQVAECLAAPCPATLRVIVPGGTWGNYTQTVGGLAMPAVGDLIGVSADASPAAWVSVEPLRDEAARQSFVAHERKAPALAQR